MLCIDLFCGLGGWADGFLAEGWDVIGFDNMRHDYGTGGYPGQLVLQDVLTLHGAQFKDVDCIVASPPCQNYSYMAMPWKLAKAKAAEIRASMSKLIELNRLFYACFDIQAQASRAAGRHIPLIVENVKGAQPWVGRAKANFGSYYLWGDVASIGGRIVRGDVPVGFAAESVRAFRAQKFNPDGTADPQGSWFAIADSKNRGAMKQPGRNFHFPEKYGIPSPSFHGAEHEPSVSNAIKTVGHVNIRDGHDHTRHLTNQRESNAVKQAGLSGPAWFDKGAVAMSSGSDSRKAASAQIAKIPFELARWVAQVFQPKTEVRKSA